MEVETRMLPWREAFIPPAFVGPVPDQFRVWVRSQDEAVRGFRITLQYEHAGQRVSEGRTVPVEPGIGALASFFVPATTVRITRLTISELREGPAIDIPAN
jgi:hypothetical protein